MSHIRDKNAALLSLLLALLLLTAQFVALAHTSEHEPGTVQNQACTSCIAASQLASACVDIPGTTDREAPGSSRCAIHDIEFESFHAIVVRQRGPPAAL